MSKRSKKQNWLRFSLEHESCNGNGMKDTEQYNKILKAGKDV